MKKLLSVSIMAMLAVSPMMAHAEPVVLDPQNSHGPAHSNTANSAANGIVAPFASETIYDTDQAGVASAAYVKGAYNAAIRAVNTVAADVATAKAVTDGIENTIKTKINDAAGNGLSTNNNGVLSVNTAETVADGGTGYVTSNLLYDQGYQNATQVGNAIDTKLTDYKVKDVANDGGIEKDASGNISLTSAVQASLGKANTALQTDSALNGANLTNGTVAFGKLNGAAYVDSTEAISTSTANDTTLATSKAVKDYVDASNTSAVSAAEFVVQNKLDDGATGYDIDAKTLKIQGTSVATKADVASTVSAASVTTSGTINLYNAWGATTTTPVTVTTTGGVDDFTYTEPQG